MCVRIEQILTGQGTLLPQVSKMIEAMAQRYAAQLVVCRKSVVSSAMSETVSEYHEVDVASLELVRSRSAGVEHVGLAALGWLELPRILTEAGLNGIQQAAVTASVIGRRLHRAVNLPPGVGSLSVAPWENSWKLTLKPCPR